MRFVVLLFSLLLMTACYPQAHVLVTNDCPGAYLRISRLAGTGNYDVVSERLMPGEQVNVSLTGTSASYNRFVIVATGFRLDNDEPLGSLEYNVSVSSGNGPTAPQNNYSWPVQWLPGGCPDR